MEYYGADSTKRYVQRVKYTLQSGEFKGSFELIFIVRYKGFNEPLHDVLPRLWDRNYLDKYYNHLELEVDPEEDYIVIRFLDDNYNVVKEEVLYDVVEEFSSRIVAIEILGFTEVE